MSRNRAAELAGLSSAEFTDLLTERGIAVDAGFLTEDERREKLDELE